MEYSSLDTNNRFGINFWPDIVAECLIDLHVLPYRLPGGHYRDFLLKVFPDILENLLVAVR
jgi:hypothetical protein